MPHIATDLLDTRKKRVLALGQPRFATEAFKALQQKYDVDLVIPHPSERAPTIEKIHHLAAEHRYDAMFWLFGTSAYGPFDEMMLSPMLPSCKLFATGGAGYDDVSTQWAADHGTYVTNTPDGPTDGTADMAVLLFLSALRGAREAEETMRSGNWRQGLPLMQDPKGKTVGLFGMGRIAKVFSRKIRAFDVARVVYHSRTQLPPDEEAALDVEYVSFEDMLRLSDVISIHCPLTAATKGIISAPEFQKMKDGVVIINTARGAVIDEEAFITSIKSGKVSRAGLDVFVDEPRVNPFWLTSNRVTVQPHWGGFSEGTIRGGEQMVLNNVMQFLETGTPINPVNQPKGI